MINRCRRINKYFLLLVRNMWKHFSRPVQNQQGVALLMAMAFMMLIMFISMEVTYDTNVEYRINANAVQRLKAYYAAKAALDISLLRIKIYQTVQSKFGKQMGSQAAMLEQIWQMPFAWPPVILPEMNGVDKDAIKAVSKLSLMDASYLATIEDEGSRIDLNDLNSRSDVVRNIARKQILNIFEAKVQDDEDFRKDYGSYRFDELVNNIADWMSSKSTGVAGADKKQLYADLKVDGKLPPNRAFRTLQELRMVAGMTDEFYEILEPRITIWGMKGINPNIATKEVLRSLDVGITDEIASEIIKRRDDSSQGQGGPFKKAGEFWEFVTQKGARLQARKPEEEIPLVFESATNFKIRATGTINNLINHEIFAVVMNISKVATAIKATNDKVAQKAQGIDTSQDQSQQQGGQSGQGGSQPIADKISKGPPRIVYWNER